MRCLTSKRYSVSSFLTNVTSLLARCAGLDFWRDEPRCFGLSRLWSVGCKTRLKRKTNQMRRKYQNILETVGDTPVVKIGKLAPAGVTLYVKIEAFNPLGSVKDRLALGVIEDAERSGKLQPGQTVIEATSGNTGIGLAMVCAQKGYPLVVTMAETFSIERRKLMRFLGAKVILTPAAERGIGMVNKAIELAETHGWFLTRQFENEANADMHSRTTAREIVEAFAGERLDG
jgi:cysteine synthase